MWKKEYDKYLKSIFNFFVKNDICNKPYPKIRIVTKKQDEELFITTGYFDNISKEIVLFVADRHLKDILRTFCHELVHLGQRQKGILNDNDGKTTSLDDKRLEKLESEAYEKGNIYFRKWTEFYQKKIGKE
jgi:hypothetical protein